MAKLVGRGQITINTLQDAYNISQSIKEYIFTGGNTGIIIDAISFSSSISVNQGGKNIQFAIGAISKPNGFSAISIDNTNKTITFSVAANTSNLAESGTILIPILIDGIAYNQSFVWSKSKKGDAGNVGLDAYTISSSRQNYIISTDKDGQIHVPISTSTTLSALRGTTPVTPVIGTLPNVAGCVLSKSGATVTLVFNIGTSLAENGVIDIPLTVDGKSFFVSFAYAKARTGANGLTGAAGVDSNMLDWVKDWNTNKTVIGSDSVITPKLFAGTKNANGTLTGVALGKFALSTLNASGSIVTETINGIYAFKEGYRTFFVDNGGNAQLGRDNQSIKYNAVTGKIEFGSDVSLNWVNAINTAKNDAIIAAAADASNKVNNLQIGGRNLVTDSKRTTEVGGDGTANVEKIGFTAQYADLTLGETYTFSCKTNGTWGNVGNTVEAFLMKDKSSTVGQYKHMNTNPCIFIAPATGRYFIRIDSNSGDKKYQFWEFKVEKGTKATDWTPSLEDVENNSNAAATQKVRYIRDWINGSSANTGNYWVQIKALDYLRNNIALNKNVSANSTDKRITNNNTDSEPYTGTGTGLQHVIIDLGAAYDIETVQVWHYYKDARIFNDSKTEVSLDGVNWFVLFDSAKEGKYQENVSGRSYFVKNYDRTRQAQEVAAKAQSDSDKANNLLGEIANDNLFIPSEKHDTLKEWQIIQGEKPTIIAQAQTYLISYTTYEISYNNLNSYITPLLSNLSVNSTIVGNDFRAKFKAYYDAKISLLKAVTDAAKSRIDSIQIGGSNLLNNSGYWKTAGWNNGIASNGGGYTINTSETYNGMPSLETFVGSGLVHPFVGLETHVEYTYSAVVKCNETITGNNNTPLHYWAGLNNQMQGKITVLEFDTSVVANVWKRIHIVFKLTGDANSFRPFFYRGGNGTTKYWIAYLQLERGNKPSDWSASRSDLNADIITAQTTADAITKKSNDEKWATKLTYIDSTGIFTGILSANTVNAIKINAVQITAGTIDAARINVAALKSELITAGNIESLTLNVVRGKIGGWNIDSDSIFGGTKNNTSGGYTTASGAITIGSQGIRGFKWKLDVNGAGALAAGNISWDAAGNVTFGSSVVLNWTNAANNALNSAKSYADVKKTEAINSASSDASSKIDAINIGGRNLLRLSKLGGAVNGGKYNDNTGRTISIYPNQWRIQNFTQSEVGAYSIGFWIKGDVAGKLSFDICDQNGQIIDVTTNWTYIKLENLYVSNYLASPYFGFIDFARAAGSAITTLYVSNFKVEFGTKCTSYTIAPEDIDSEIVDARNVADKVVTALGGTSYPKLTQISSTGIYTGTLTATQITAGIIHVDRLDANSIKSNIINTNYINGLTCTFDKGRIGGWSIGGDTITIGSIGGVGAIPIQIRSTSVGSGAWFTGAYKPYGLSLLWFQNANAGHIVFGQVAANGTSPKTGFIGIQMMAWDNTEYFCLSARHDLANAKEVYNRIAGWAFDNTRIWKNNVSLGADGAIYNGNLWRLNNDGSGQLANGNIGWNALGVVTFSAAVSLSWTAGIKSIVSALGGSSYPKLTRIDGSGIYTGTLAANQINAVSIDAGSLKTGTLSADRIAAGSINSVKLDANSIKANIINTDYINGLTCSFERGKIGGWNIGIDSITMGSVGAVGSIPIQIRSSSIGSGYWYSGQYKPYGLSMLWYQNNNAGHIVFGQVAANGSSPKTGFIGIQMMAWDNTEYFCLSARHDLSGSKEVYNRIAGWAFDNTRIWKNNVSLGADGAIYNGNLWKFNNDGSGQIANGNISWNAAGAVTFGSSVSLNWINEVNKGRLYIRGTGLNNNAQRIISLSGVTIHTSGLRGLMLTVINRDNLVVVSHINYDVYASDTNCNSLAAALNALGADKIIVLTSYDAIRINATLKSAIQRCGGSDILVTDDRVPYALIGIPTIGKDNGLLAVFRNLATDPYAELSTDIVNGIPQGINMGGKQKTYIDGNGIYTGSLSTGQINVDSALVVGGSTYNGSISVRDAANAVKVTLDRTGITAVAGVIGGWVISASQISKGSVTLSADGSITNGNLWRLNIDGSGQVANGNVSWTAAGAVSVTGVINATSGKIGGFTIEGNTLSNNAGNSSIAFNNINGASFVRINEDSYTLLALRADSAKTAISIQTYATGAVGLTIIANAGSTYAIASAGPHRFYQRYGEVWNAPGVLFSAIVKNSNTLYNQWGNGVRITSFVREKTGFFRVKHNLGHLEYTVMITPYWDNGTNWHSNAYVRVEYIDYNEFCLRVVNADNGGLVDTCFTFCIVGRNSYY